MSRPPGEVVELAERTAAQSPCSKSKRGVVAYMTTPDVRVLSVGFNGPPHGFVCDGSPECRATCGKFCVHAELRALWGAWSHLGDAMAGHLVQLVHVKIGDAGKLVPGGGPSCWQCSRHILDAGAAGIWLYESPSGVPYTLADEDAPGAWRYYTAVDFHTITLANTEIVPFASPRHDTIRKGA